MDTQTVWLLVMSIATPVAGVLGFGIQLRQVKKARLENDKLQLEMAALRQRAANAERRIVLATNAEVQKITHGEVLFSKSSRVRGDEEPEVLVEQQAPKLMERLFLVGVIALVSLFLAYLVYDLYRITVWLWTLL